MVISKCYCTRPRRIHIATCSVGFVRVFWGLEAGRGCEYVKKGFVSSVTNPVLLTHMKFDEKLMMNYIWFYITYVDEILSVPLQVTKLICGK